MSAIPNENIFNALFFFIKDGYNFINKRCKKLGSDVFQTGILNKNFIFITGAEAAELFYDTSKFVRRSAIPVRVQNTLVGKRAIHTLDAEVHRKRKEMFMSVMTDENINKLSLTAIKYWQDYIKKWEEKDRIVFFEEVQEIMCRTACNWAGVDLVETEVKQRTNDFVAMIDAFGAVGPRHQRGKDARERTEKWIGDFLQQVRDQRIKYETGSSVEAVINFKDEHGRPLDNKVAAVELINLIRPTVAISYYILFAALAIFQHPQYKSYLIRNEDRFQEMFVNEVRRFFPFAPFMGAKVKESFAWKGFQFPKKALVMLDIYGTNHDARYWAKPNEFYPENFKDWSKSPFDFIPQGGGQYLNGHRCPGEWITIEAMKVAIKFLTKLDYEVPQQDLSYSLTRMPTYPESGFIMTNIKATSKVLEDDYLNEVNVNYNRE